MTFRGRATGFEFVADADAAGFADENHDVSGLSGYVYIGAFNIRTGPGEFPAALVAAVSLAELGSGVVFDPQSGKVYSKPVLRELLSQVAMYHERVRAKP